MPSSYLACEKYLRQQQLNNPERFRMNLNIDPLTVPLKLPEGEKLLAFQDPGIRYLLHHLITRSMKATYNACDVGTGKSLMTIALANTINSQKNLVICPASVRGSWEAEIKRFSTQYPLTVRTVYKGQDLKSPITAAWTIISYSLIINSSIFHILHDTKWDLVVFDEAQELANTRAKKTQACIFLYNKARKAQFLSGTPIRRSTLDLFPACHMILPDEFPDQDEFAERFCLRKNVPWGQGWEWHSGKNLEELKNIIQANFYYRKTKAEVLPDLPDQTLQKIVLDCGKFDYQVTEQEEQKILKAVHAGQDPNTALKTTHISKKRLEVGLKTLKEGHYFITDFLDANIPVVLFTYHHAIIDQAMSQFKEHNPVKLDGTVTGVKKDQAIAAFRDGLTNLFIAQIQSGGVGINGLQHRCSTAIFAEWSYGPSDINQAIARLCRHGQKNAVNAYFLVAKNSIDEKVLDIVIKKERMIHQVIQPTKDL